MNTASYVGRFAPSPTGPLHAGSLVAALASWLDARAWNAGRGGRWLVRIEDVDTPRCVPGAAERILAQLATCGLLPDAPPLWQSHRGALYQQALDQLVDSNLAYPCACSRKDIEMAMPRPGTHTSAMSSALSRHLSPRPAGAHSPVLAVCHHRFHAKQAQTLTHQAQDAFFSIASDGLHWTDRRLGPQQQDVARSVGDFVLLRADGLWAYQLAVVVDDAAQGITHVVRGEDLADNTPRQILLQQACNSPRRSICTRRWCGAPMAKNSPSSMAQRPGAGQPAQALQTAAQVLGLPALVHPDNTRLGDAPVPMGQAWMPLYNRAL